MQPNGYLKTRIFNALSEYSEDDGNIDSLNAFEMHLDSYDNMVVRGQNCFVFDRVKG